MTQVFNRLTAIVASLPLTNVDTDKIIPGRFLKTISREGLGNSLFYSLRYDNETGRELPNFVLNRMPWRKAEILVTLENFGCGSSREHAPWALVDFGITCIIAPSFADIFFNNCFKNGILPITVDHNICTQLMKLSENPDEATITVDLLSQTILLNSGLIIRFQVPKEKRISLLEGIDEIQGTLTHLNEIKLAEQKRKCWMPTVSGIF